jgi:uncharacterized protein (DUF433 family)
MPDDNGYISIGNLYSYIHRQAQQLGITEAQLLQDYPHITAADLVNAWTYAEAYPEEIAAVILANNEAA